ncbi:MAG: ORF6N domain-containing protein [Candidatus Saganbacteria bacterium]|nr:ORF6N domain-containing protein [Candidatus Saganbacteria bacterium]
MSDLIPSERIEDKIYLIRGQKVILDYDLASLYKVRTKHLKRQVKRNLTRFPEDFMFQLTTEEALRCQIGTSNLKSQIATSSRGGRRYLPFAFTEPGIAMLSSVLNSERAVQVNIIIMRTFIRLRKILATHKELADKLKELESKFNGRWGKHEIEIQGILKIIRKLLQPPRRKTGKIGFLRDRD